MEKQSNTGNQDIAIVGISLFCPAGDSVDEFWDGISKGGDFITEAPPEVIEAYHFQGKPNGVDRFYCNRGGFSRQFKLDPFRYGILPIAAHDIDPDQLVSLAGAEQALIDAGLHQKEMKLQNCSVIIGKGNFSGVLPLRTLEIMRISRQITTTLKEVLPELTERDLEKIKEGYQKLQGRYQPDIAIGMMPNLIASLVANKFDMHGPAYMIDAACASGVVAINHSINLLRTGQVDIALAGGMHSGHSAMFWGAFDLMGAMSRKQVIAPFSADADGLLVGQGGGFVVLKTLEKAIKDDDRIYAVIKETSVCSDGGGSHVMVTSVDGQMRVLEQAWSKSGMDPKNIGYIEAHGTATIIGDRTEITTLKNFFGDNTFPRAYVGSVKSNIGHTMPAAGMLGVIKTALALYWRKIPPTLHCENPLSAMFESRFLPPQELIDWDGKDIPLVAGVNAFGFGGINAHAIMTAYERDPSLPKWKTPRVYKGETLMMSAVDGPTMITKLKVGDYTDLGGDYRLVMFNATKDRIKQAIQIVEKDKPWRGRADIWFTNRPMIPDGGKIVFLFPGFSFEHETETDSLSEDLDLPFMKDLIATYTDGTETGEAILQSHFIQQLSKGALEKLEFEADMYAGHSIGEWDATAFAGITEDTDGEELLKKVFDWGDIKTYPIIAVSGMDRHTLEAWCSEIPDIWLANDNCPRQVILGGEEAGVAAMVEKLKENKVLHTVLPYGTGWHTPLAAKDMQTHEDFLDAIQIKPGRVPVWSSSTLDLIPTDKDEYIELVRDQLTKPVYFRELIQKLYDEQQARIFIQIGLGSTVGFVEDILKDKDFGAIATNISSRSASDQLRRIGALLFVEGREVNPFYMGVKPIYRAEHSLMILPMGAPPIHTEIPGLKEVLRERYGDAGPGIGLAAGAPPNAHPIAKAAHENITDAIAVQREVLRFFERVLPADGAQAMPAPTIQRAGIAKAPEKKAAAAKARTGQKFEEAVRLTLEDHPYLLDHAIIRQPKDWPFHEDLNPVVPFAMTLEVFAEIALKHAPGQKLLKVSNVSALRWISVEKPFEETMKGEWLSEDVLRLDLGGFAKCDCLMGDEWLPVPEEIAVDEPFDLGPEIMEPRPPEELYDRFSFHGPMYHCGIRYKRLCARGMEGIAQKKEGKGSLLDNMGQQLGLFLHLTQTENTISFPVRLKELIFFDDLFNQDGIFEAAAHITRLTKNVIAADGIYKRDGKVWLYARDYVCQRFVNYIPVWNVILKPQQHLLAEEIAPNIYFYEHRIEDNVLLMLGKRYLNSQDLGEIESLDAQRLMRERTKVISRISLKDAVRAYTADENGEMIYPIEFTCRHDDLGKPFLRGYGPVADKVDHLCVSLADKPDASIAMVAESPVGIDLEIIEEKTEDFLKIAYTDAEIALLEKLNDPEAVIRFWVAKEACGKQDGVGLQGNPKRYEVSAVDGDDLFVGDRRVHTVKLGEKYIAGWTVTTATTV